MPFDYRLDDARRVIRLTATEPIGLLDVTTMVDRQLADGAWQYGMLVDARQAILSPVDSRGLFEYIRKIVEQHGPHGPIALVRRQDLGSAQVFAFRSAESDLSFEVFWDVDEAERWIASRL